MKQGMSLLIDEGANMRKYTDIDIARILNASMDAILIVSSIDDTYRRVKCTELFSELIDETGSYKDLIEKLCFHMSENNARISDDYQVFLPKMIDFKGKYARKLSCEINGERHKIQMFVCPTEKEEGEYIIVLTDLDQSENDREIISEKKVKTIQETYLFSMYIDLNNDKISGINVTEISNDDMHYEIKYSEWRMMIVNMIWPDDQPLFLEKSNPECLKAALKPAKTLSFDCQMKNLEGQFIWVRLIFGRIDTTSEQDFRFVFMVQNIHEDSMRLFKELKKFENLASYDALTSVYNHGRIETEINNAIVEYKGNNGKCSLMMLDIDFFKEVNDTYGHAVGDDTLKAFISCVKETLTDYDVRIGRWGGEEFVCVCYGYDMDAIKEIAEKTRAAVESRTFDIIGHMTCSIGIACIYKDDTADTAFKRLDEALYDAKSNGRNCVKIKE